MTSKSSPRHARPAIPAKAHGQEQTKPDATIIVAIIGILGTLATVIFAFPPFIRWVDSVWFPSPTSTVTIAVPAAAATETLLPPATDNGTPFAFPVETSIPTFTPIPPRMVVVTWANKYAGDVPLTVKFSAEDSYMEFSDGSRAYCTPSTCTFVWSVFNVTLNGVVATPQSWRESFTYTFYKEGLYYVKVTVCQGGVCADGQIQVEGR